MSRTIYLNILFGIYLTSLFICECNFVKWVSICICSLIGVNLQWKICSQWWALGNQDVESRLFRGGIMQLLSRLPAFLHAFTWPTLKRRAINLFWMDRRPDQILFWLRIEPRLCWWLFGLAVHSSTDEQPGPWN